MSDKSYIYKMNMIEENEQMEEDILSGRGMDVLFCLMDNIKTSQEIAGRLGMPKNSVQLYLQRLMNAGLVEEDTTAIQSGQSEKSYQLVSDQIDIVSQLQEKSLLEATKKRKSVITAQYLSIMARNAIKSASLNPEKPNMVKAHFMKAKKEDMEKFINEIEQLFQKYQAKEDLDATDTYSLFTVLAPYQMED